MTIYRIPGRIGALIFDIDGTLYTSREYVAEQVDAQVRHWAHIHGMAEEEARGTIAMWRKNWSSEHGGKSISLGNTFLALGVPIETSIKWRNTLLEPERFLHPDERLCETVALLGKRFSLVCLTNNPVQAARRTLRAIGIDTLIPHIVGLDTCMRSKPDVMLLDEACRLAGCAREECLCVGDRYDIDLALPLSLGMGGILVSGAEDVCALQELLGGT